MAWWYLRRIVRDHRRDVVLGREPHTEGHVISTGPYDDPGHALQFAIAAQNDPPREWGTMDFENLDLVESAERPAPKFDEVRDRLRARGIPGHSPVA
jgi:hypothetical protein